MNRQPQERTEDADEETSWQKLARKRQRRKQLDAEIARESAAAAYAARAAGVSTKQLADLWEVSETWIYTVAPVRSSGHAATE